MMRLRPGDAARSWPRLPRRSARLRLTALFGGLFLISGAALLTVTYLLVEQATEPGSGGDATRFGLAAGSSPGDQISITTGSRLTTRQINAAQAAAVNRVVRGVLAELLKQSPVALAIATVAAVALGWIAAGRILRPLSTITAAARQISASNLNERLALQGPDDELKALGNTLDDLFARLESSFTAQRHFVANASHELRTPLTRERTMLQVALDDPATPASVWRDTAREVLASNAGQESLLEALLTLASSEGGIDKREPADLAAITGMVLLARRAEADRAELRIETATRPAPMDGDPLLAERLVANLVDNAIRHNVPGGRIDVGTGSVQGRALLSVRNTGPVILAAEVDRLFQPFQRGAGRRAASQQSGHGLGLSIVRAIATAHDASVTALARPEGGLAIDVTFPAPAAASRLAAAPASQADTLPVGTLGLRMGPSVNSQISEFTRTLGAWRTLLRRAACGRASARRRRSTASS